MRWRDLIVPVFLVVCIVFAVATLIMVANTFFDLPVVGSSWLSFK